MLSLTRFHEGLQDGVHALLPVVALGLKPGQNVVVNLDLDKH
jgi:hypothetical protein